MGHTHDHTHGHAHAGDTDNIKVAFFLNLAFTVAEIFGGLWTNSVTILSDALHDLGDSLSLGLSWYLDRYAQRGRSERYSYGYARFSVLGALINSIVLIVGSILILSEAVPRILNPEPSDARGMFFFAIGGILINGLAVLRLRGGKSINVQVVAWHLLEDVLGWVAVLVVSIVLMFREIQVLDPILSIVITLYVLYNVVVNLKKTLGLFLQSVPEGLTTEEIDEALLGVRGVESTHHTHVWSLDGVHHVLTTHVVVDACATREEVLEIKERAKDCIEEIDVEIQHITVEIEYNDEVCRMPPCA